MSKILKEKEVPCKWCGIPTTYAGTKFCDWCWHTEGGIKHLVGKKGIEGTLKILKRELNKYEPTKLQDK